MNKTRLKDFFVVVSCLSVAAVSINMFRLDLFQTIASQNAEPVGSVTVRSNNVQRRFGDRVLWGRLIVESPIYIGDLIRVAEYSSARLNIEDNIITLNENTLIRILRSIDREGRIIFDIGMGNIEIASPRGISLSLTGGRSIETGLETILNVIAEPETELAAVASDNVVSVFVREGNAAVTWGDNQNRILYTGEFFAIDANNEEYENEAVFLQTILDQTVESVLENVLEIAVENIEPMLPFVIEPETVTAAVPTPVSTIAPAPAPVSAPASRNAAAPPATVSAEAAEASVVAAVSAPQLLPAPAQSGRLPVNGHRVSIEELRRARRIDFSWPAVSGADAYIFTLHHQSAEGRRQVVRTEPMERTNWTLNNLNLLELGTFVWSAEAIAVGSGSTIERRGIIAETSFIIDIPIPRLPETDDIEIDYGN